MVLVRTDVSEERISSNIKGISWPILVTLMMDAIRSSETSFLKRVTRRHIPEDGILYSQRLENLKSYVY
jgi:hypothetical protein